MIDQIVPIVPDSSRELGNTKPTPPQVSPSKRWCFTMFVKEIVPEFQKIVKGKYIIGKEICPETGKEHLQGYIEFDVKCRPMGVFKEFNNIHWELAKGNREQNITYCSKEGKYETNFEIAEKVKDPLEGKELYDWQKEILEIIGKEPDDRKIYWYWEETGNVGKTALCKHIVLNHNAIVLSGKGTDIKQGIVSHLDNRKSVKIAIFHYTRSNEEFVSYEALEAIKDGMFFSGKYESSMVVFNSPHVIVMANFKPKLDKLSRDRWIVKEIVNYSEFE